MNILKIPKKVVDRFRYYVYLYIDPRNEKIKYVGKGKGNRYITHLKDRSESEKVKWLKELKSAGYEPRIDILARNLTEEQALLVERSVIDAIGVSELTNAVRGSNVKHGREQLEEIAIQEQAKPATIYHRVLIFRLNNTYKPNMGEEEIYEMTRGVWVVNQKRRQKAQYAFGVFRGIVRGVFSIDNWHPAGSTKYRFRPDIKSSKTTRLWEFTQNAKAPQEIVDMYLYKSVREYLKNQTLEHAQDGLEKLLRFLKNRPVLFVEGSKK
ncbi:MAG: hypothetical protein OXF45_02935 [Candidatus Dadabacteria bacterium]|nr:hypothetical protein [Candidatus Dadabacteria bacterium]